MKTIESKKVPTWFGEMAVGVEGERQMLKALWGVVGDRHNVVFRTSSSSSSTSSHLPGKENSLEYSLRYRLRVQPCV